MDAETTTRLVALNNAFYRENAASFSDTRQHPWRGWERLVTLLPRRPRSALDIACGNMRFKRFLDDAYGTGAVAYVGVDSCAELVPGDLFGSYVEADVLEALATDTRNVAGTSALSELRGKFDLVACFGFLHHVPGTALRKRFVDQLIGFTAPGGMCALSLWQFGRDERVFRKACETTTRARDELGVRLDENDYFLGWKDAADAYRYCHNFTDEDIRGLIRHAEGKARLVARFSADGKTGNLNEYLLLTKKS